MTYLLSNRQKKELLVRHRPLRIALPAPSETPADPAAWARGALESDVARLVVSAEETELTVRPTFDKSKRNLTDIIGAIVPDDGQMPDWTICVAAIVVELRPANAIHSPMPVQWPANVRVGGRLFVRDVD